MQRFTSRQNDINNQTVFLYRMVFEVRFIKYIVAFMFVFFLLQPVSTVFASEEDVSTDAVEVIIAAPSTPSVVDVSPEIVIEESPVVEVLEELLPVVDDSLIQKNEATDNEEGIVSVDASLQEVEQVTDTNSQELSENTQTLATDSSEDVPVDDTQPQLVTSSTAPDTQGLDVENSDTQELVEENQASSTFSEADVAIGTTTSPQSSPGSTSSGSSGASQDTGSAIDPVLDNPVADADLAGTATDTTEANAGSVQVQVVQASSSVATSTELFVEGIVPVIELARNNLNAFQFSNKECVSVGDGSFYCSQDDAAPEYVEDGVFSAPDSDGDSEIYVTIAGETTQITNNLVDDASPYYDGLSNSIVWHSMKNDRFQIVQYDALKGDIQLVTDAPYNNMEPVVYGNIILWQAWVGDNWEIMLYDGASTTQLTHNQTHDITPQIRDGYIIWQTQFSEGWKIALYDTKTGKVQYIADSDGSNIANPRFVLVYDSKDEVGDVKTLGYDFGSGDSFTLGQLPVQLPKKLPKSDQTGETSALIQTKPGTREGKTGVLEPVVTGSGDDNAKQATSTVAFSENTASSTDNLTENDIVIAPMEAATTTQELPGDTAAEVVVENAATSTAQAAVEHIEDVVIPPFVGTSTNEVG